MYTLNPPYAATVVCPPVPDTKHKPPDVKHERNRVTMTVAEATAKLDGLYRPPNVTDAGKTPGLPHPPNVYVNSDLEERRAAKDDTVQKLIGVDEAKNRPIFRFNFADFLAFFGLIVGVPHLYLVLILLLSNLLSANNLEKYVNVDFNLQGFNYLILIQRFIAAVCTDFEKKGPSANQNSSVVKKNIGKKKLGEATADSVVKMAFLGLNEGIFGSNSHFKIEVKMDKEKVMANLDATKPQNQINRTFFKKVCAATMVDVDLARKTWLTFHIGKGLFSAVFSVVNDDEIESSPILFGSEFIGQNSIHLEKNGTSKIMAYVQPSSEEVVKVPCLVVRKMSTYNPARLASSLQPRVYDQVTQSYVC